jgi:excisionase family DNA binding protein
MSTAPVRDLYPEEVAAKLEVSTRTLANWIREGKAPPSRKVRGRRLFDATVFEEWLKTQNGDRP